MTIPTITVLVPTYNRSAMLRNTLACMIAQETDERFTFEIMVIDDVSTDDTVAVVREFIAASPVPIRYILGKGRGITEVYNLAVEEFCGEWMAFFDDDQVTNSNCWLKDLYSAALEQGADMVGGPILLDLPENILAGIGPVCRDLYGESPEVRHPERYTKTNPLPAGGNRLVRRRVFERIGGFDGSILTGGGDRDFLLRAKDAGVVMGWASTAPGMHQIPPERIQYKHVKWYSVQWGCSFAHIDRKRFGLVKTMLSAIARVVQTLLVHVPMLLWGWIRGDSKTILDRQALYWRTVGYVRRALQLLAPKIFTQEKFFARVEFRRGRETT